MKIAIVGCYYNMESYKCMMDALISIGNTVDFFPMLYYHHNDKNNVEKDFQAFLDGKSSNDKVIVNRQSNKDPLQIIIWRCYLAPKKIFQMTRDQGIINVLYNCTDPFETMEHNIDSSNLSEILPYFDTVFTTSKKSIDIYHQHGVKNVYHTTMAIDPMIHKPINAKSYDCDVSFVINSLYIDNPYGIDRKKLLDRILQISNIKVDVYGPSYLKEFYPNNYVAEVPYDQSSKIFATSKINLNTHHINPDNNGDSLNERTFQIIASGGLMLTDIPHTSILCADCFIKIDETNIESQITDILQRYDNCSIIRDIKKTAISSSKKFTFKIVMTNILNQIKKDFFKNERPAFQSQSVNTNIKQLIDTYKYQDEIKHLVQIIKLTGPSDELFDQLKILSNTKGININNLIK